MHTIDHPVNHDADKLNHKTLSNSSAFWHQKCPRCHGGKVFKYSSFSLKFAKMNEHCPVCGLKYEIETGFFWGSMYISYFMTAIIGFIVAYIDFLVVKEPPVWQIVGCICVALFILSPITFRYSRLIMLYSFGSIKYDPKAGGALSLKGTIDVA